MLNKKVAKNATWIVGCRMTQAVFALVINFLTARYLGPSNFGVINYAASLVAFVVPIMNLGVTSIIVNEMIKDPENEGEILGTSVVMTLVSSFSCIIGLGAFVFLANAGDTETQVVCILYSLLLIAQSLEILQYWFQAHYLSKYTSLTVLFSYLVISIYKIFLLITKKSVYWFAVSHALDYVLIAIILIVIYKKLGGQKLRFSFKQVKNLFSQGKHYIIADLMGVALAQTDRIMLKFSYDNEAVGLYSAAISICSLTSFVFAAIVDSMRPLILQYKHENEVSYEKSVSLLYGIVIFLSLIQAIFISVFAKEIIELLYGYEFMPAVTTLRIVVWYTVFTYIGTVRSVWILAEHKQKYLWVISLTGLILNVLLNVCLIPIWGIEGAAVATLITQMFGNCFINYFIKQMKYNNTLLLKGFNVKEIIRSIIK